MSYDYPYGIPPINIMDRKLSFRSELRQKLRQELTQIDQRVQFSPESHPDMKFLQGAQVALSWVLYPGIFNAPIEHLQLRGKDRLANWLEVSG